MSTTLCYGLYFDYSFFLVFLNSNQPTYWLLNKKNLTFISISYWFLMFTSDNILGDFTLYNRTPEIIVHKEKKFLSIHFSQICGENVPKDNYEKYGDTYF